MSNLLHPNLICVGLNHHHAPIEIRERVAFDKDKHQEASSHLILDDHIHETVIVSTCNRVEVYAHGKLDSGPERIADFFHRFHDLKFGSLSQYLYRFTGLDALQQIFRVTSSLDSQIIGEPQIQGQVKSAFLKAQQLGTAGPLIHQTFSHALSVAKRIRRETEIGNLATSTAYAAIQLGEKVLGSLANKKALIIGAGDMAHIAGKHLTAKGASLTILNRSLENAQTMAAGLNAKAGSLESLDAYMSKADVIFSSSAATHHLITKEMCAKAIRDRRYRPMFLIDISVPRNIAPDVQDVDGVYAYDIDDLTQIIRQNQSNRNQAARTAMDIIQEEMGTFQKRLHTRQFAPLISELKQESLDIAAMEAERLIQSLGNKLTDADKEKIARSSLRIANKVLHRPLLELKK